MLQQNRFWDCKKDFFLLCLRILFALYFENKVRCPIPFVCLVFFCLLYLYLDLGPCFRLFSFYIGPVGGGERGGFPYYHLCLNFPLCSHCFAYQLFLTVLCVGGATGGCVCRPRHPIPGSHVTPIAPPTGPARPCCGPCRLCGSYRVWATGMPEPGMTSQPGQPARLGYVLTT